MSRQVLSVAVLLESVEDLCKTATSPIGSEDDAEDSERSTTAVFI
jgi:hypothetical protein